MARIFSFRCLSLIVFPALVLGLAVPAASDDVPQVSSLGRYSGYSEPVYDSYARVSRYVTVHQGTDAETDLAVDLYMPTRDGKVFYEYLDDEGNPVKLPVIWTMYIYHRAFFVEGGYIIPLPEMDLWLWTKEVMKYGYVVAAVDYRGGGASYGTRQAPFTDLEAQDGYAITEWLAVQDWCTGDVGMFGRSYMGITQYTVAGTKPPHLRCIFPEMAMFDMYSFVYPGGVFHHEFLGTWNFITRTCDLNIPAVFPPVAPVDDDPYGVRLQEAILQHLFNGDILQIAATAPFRDTADQATGRRLHLDLSPSRFVAGLDDSDIPVYHMGSWYDIWPRDTLLWYANLDNPQKITMCPGPHMYSDHEFLAAEHLRWYDYWLKGIENGVMDEPSIHYFTMGESPERMWRGSDQWPLRNRIPLRFYFHKGRTGSVNSVNDGFLKALPSRPGADSREVDYTTTTGLANRWTNAYGGPFEYPDMTANDEKGLTYTTRRLPCDMRITGHPVVHLWVTSTAADGDFFAYLEEVDAQGVSSYLTEGTLRASHRKLSEPVHDNLGLPWHRSYLEDISPLEEETPTELVFDLHPTSNVFDKGNRIRVTITCADRDNNLTPELSPAPTVTVRRGCRKGSYITLPIIIDLDR